ncbi:hypothetical protein F5Y09DRAFT_264701 [Xylaria sp. FL1042]|nr:hypothetical protein F5Y09DRAFT_264701 [Xylaria sp. FL1042]
MNTTSPSKRRALAPLDANTRSPLGPSRLSPSKLGLPKLKMTSAASPVKSSPIKRPIEQGGDLETPGSAKKRRVSETKAEPLSPRNEKPLQKGVDDTPRPRSTSPEDLSLFDNSTIENSQVTVISEPDVETTTTPTVAPAVTENRPRQSSMTREEARQKAEILRLRLGLAGYKVKTNQTDVPLDKLQVRPLPGRGTKRTPSTICSPALRATSTQCKTIIPRKDEKQRLSSPARIERDSRRTVLPPAPSPSRRGSGSSAVPNADVDKSPIITQETEQTLPPTVLNTPQQSLTGKNADRFADNELGGAAEGLLSLSQSSPASTLK